MKIPETYFNSDLRDLPLDRSVWEEFAVTEDRQLKTAVLPHAQLEHLEKLGMALRVLQRLDKADVTLARAVSLARQVGPETRVAQNLARLAHVYQWQRKFGKAHDLYDQIRELGPLPESLTASLHQHLGKVFFDAGHYASAVAEFKTALRIRELLNVPDDQLQSSLQALAETEKRLGSSVPVRRAFAQDAQGIHVAHMRSINEVCSRDHTSEEIVGWGSRQFDSERRKKDIAAQWLWVTEVDKMVAGYSQLKIFYKDGKQFGYISGLYLTPESLGKSVGKSMLKIMLDVLAARDAESVTLESTITALPFYKKYGFYNCGPERIVDIGGSKVRCYPLKFVLK